MTRLQKQIFYYLFTGCTISPTRGNGFRLRSENNSPVAKFHYRSFRKISMYLRENKKGLLELNKVQVLSLRGNNWIKREYKKSRKTNSLTLLYPKKLKNSKLELMRMDGQLELF